MSYFPVVSVLMTAYNRANFIGEAIESVIASTFTEWELIIVDDCSNDDTLNIARSYELTDSRIRVYQNEQNLGDYPNRNRAASYASGKYIKYLDSDDVISPEGLKYCLDEMQRFPASGMGMLYLQNRHMQNSMMMSSEEAIRHHFFDGSVLSIGPSGSIYKRELFEKLKGFDPGYGVASDNMFNLVMAIHTPVVFFHRVFFDYRIHDAQENKNEMGYLIQNYHYNKDILTHPELPLTQKEKLYLSRKLEKRFMVNIAGYAVRIKKLTLVAEIIRLTGFKWWNVYRYIFY
jgi:glycosyltransferase involved in cell wall biosynthesis